MCSKHFSSSDISAETNIQYINFTSGITKIFTHCPYSIGSRTYLLDFLLVEKVIVSLAKDDAVDKVLNMLTKHA